MHVQAQELLLLSGRLLMGWMFVFAGIRHFVIIPMLSQALVQRGLPAPRLLLAFGATFQIAAGLLLSLGVLVPIAAVGLVIFMIAASVMLLNFWNMEGVAREEALNSWLSNIGVIGGLLMLAAHPIRMPIF